MKCFLNYALKLLSSNAFYKKKIEIKVVEFEEGRQIEAKVFGSETLCGSN